LASSRTTALPLQPRLRVLTHHYAGPQEFNRDGVQIMSPHFMAQPDGTVCVLQPKCSEPPGSTGIDPAARQQAS